MNSSERPGLVHRIDKDTSGLLVIAKTEAAMSHLRNNLKLKHPKGSMWLGGECSCRSGTIEGNVARHVKDRMQMAVLLTLK
jgi:23S rRNA pseudouridine1911/1915/1917 synthase